MRFVLLWAMAIPLVARGGDATTRAYAPRPRQEDVEHNRKRLEEFAAFDPKYEASMGPRMARLYGLGAHVYVREGFGQKIRRSHQILSEVIWLEECTADFAQIDRRLDDLEESLKHPEREAGVDEQDRSDGSFGGGHSVWWLKLSASFDHFDEELKIQPTFLDQINSPEKLTAYFESVRVSDIAKTGVDHYREFNESLSCLQRMLIRGQPKNYAFHPKLKETLFDLIHHRFRNAETGWWGPSYVRGGKVVFIDDLSMTFHTISYFKGDVSDLEKVIDTALAVKELDFPVGWLWEGDYWNHNCMDVAELFRWGWPVASAEQKAAMAGEIESMLKWCIEESLQPDGSFKTNIADGSIEEGTYYGVSFLARIGYFDKRRRFWTGRDFPECEEVRQRILGFVRKHRKSGATGGHYYSGALKELKGTEP